MTWLTRQRFLIGALVASLALNVAFVVSLANSGGLRRILMKFDLAAMPPTRAPFQVADEERYRLLPNTAAEVIFAGDSLVNAGPWAEFYSEIHNRGIGGERTDGLLARLDEILDSHPRKIIFLVGSNDLSVGVPVVQILRNYRTLLTRVHAESPATRVYVSALLPINPTVSHPPAYTNRDVQAVNQELARLVGEFPFATYFDLTGLLVDERGNLKLDYTTDGLHINIKGYLALREKLRTVFDTP